MGGISSHVSYMLIYCTTEPKNRSGLESITFLIQRQGCFSAKDEHANCVCYSCPKPIQSRTYIYNSVMVFSRQRRLIMLDK